MIILDWNKNSKEVLTQGHYNTKRSVNAEQTHLCRYWQEQGVEYNEAYKIWVLLESPQVVASLDDTERKEYFDKFWNVALQQGPNKAYIYGLTQKEYEFINSLQVDKEYKNFLRSLVEFCRTYGYQGHCSCSYAILTFLKKQGRKNLPDKRAEKMVEWNKKYCLYDCVVAINEEDEKEKTRCEIIVRFLDQGGAVQKSLRPFDDERARCPECGQYYYKKSSARVDLCRECYLKHRRINTNKNFYNKHK